MLLKYKTQIGCLFDCAILIKWKLTILMCNLVCFIIMHVEQHKDLQYKALE